MHRKALVLSITILQLVIFGSLIGWRVADWREIGWTGMAYHLDAEVETETPRAAIFWRAESRQVEMVVPGGPADRAGITDEDLVVEVNGIPVAEFDRLQELASGLRRGDSATYRLERNDSVRNVIVHLENPYRHPVIIAATATSVAAGAVFLLISMLVYWSRPRSQVALVFFLMCVFGAAEYLIWAVIELDLPSLRGIKPAVIEPVMFVGLALVGVFSIALINTLLHLSLVFPRRRPAVEKHPTVVVWLHTLPFLMPAVLTAVISSAVLSKTVVGLTTVVAVLTVWAVTGCIRLYRSVVRNGLRETIRSRPLLTQGLLVCLSGVLGLAIRLLPEGWRSVVVVLVFLATFAVGLAAIIVYSVMIIVSLLRSYRESGTDERQQVRWPLWGTLTAVAGSVLLMVISLVFSLLFGELGHIDFTANVVLTAMSKIVYLLIPISLAVGIVKYRLMEIDLIIRKTVVYSMVTGFILVVYLVLAGVSGLALVRSAGLQSQAATVVATLVVVALFVPVRNRVQRVVDRSFFQREHDTEASIARITDAVTTSTSLEKMSLAVAEEVQKALRCRAVAVMVRRAGSDRLSTEATVGLPETAVHGLSLPATSPVFQSFDVHVVVDRSELTDEEQRVGRRTAASRAVICRRGDEPLGLITVGRKLSREPFDDGDEVFLEAVAGQLAVGVARLHGRRAELEFAQALQIQRSLLPAEIPQIGGVEVVARWQPAREVSGDYYDVLRLADRQLALCIGDVVGKGMPAALLMSSLQAAVKAVATPDADPAQVCSQVRSVVTSSLSGGKFVTFFYAVIDGDRRRLRYTNCGHNQPVLVRADGSVTRLSEGGPAFARLMRELAYATGEITLAPGDRLVLFTDGVSEAADAEGEQFGEDRIVELAVEHRVATARHLEEAIERSVLDHADGELQDDLTLVVAAVE